MPGIPRRHHFVTKAYLEGFLELGEKHLSCYMRRRSEPFLSMPVNLANIRDSIVLRGQTAASTRVSKF
jgi:hypothetical protein